MPPEAPAEPNLPVYRGERSLTMSRGAIALRLLDPRTAIQVAELAGGGIHDPAYMPFSVPWSEGAGDQVSAELMRWMERAFADSTEESWTLLFGVWRDEQLVGATNLVAHQHTSQGVVSTGSWLGLNFQGQGTGKAMRMLLLDLAFEVLRSRMATSEAFHDNTASRAVNESLGYREVGRRAVERRGEQESLVRYELSSLDWARRDDGEFTIRGHEWINSLAFQPKK